MQITYTIEPDESWEDGDGIKASLYIFTFPDSRSKHHVSIPDDLGKDITDYILNGVIHTFMEGREDGINIAKNIILWSAGKIITNSLDKNRDFHTDSYGCTLKEQP